jgi:hypothetical protein
MRRKSAAMAPESQACSSAADTAKAEASHHAADRSAGQKTRGVWAELAQCVADRP